MSTLSNKNEALKRMDVLNLWASICGETMDRMEIPWECEVMEDQDGVRFSMMFSSTGDKKEQSKWNGAINWATDTMVNFAGTTQSNEIYVDWNGIDELDVWFMIDRDLCADAFSKGLPLLDYLGFVPHESLDAAMDPME